MFCVPWFYSCIFNLINKLINIWCICYSLWGQQRKCRCLQRATQTVTTTVTENIMLRGFNVTSLREPSGEQKRLMHIHSWNIRKTSETAWHQQQQQSCAPPRYTGPLTYAMCSFLWTKILLTALKLLTKKTTLKQIHVAHRSHQRKESCFTLGKTTKKKHLPTMYKIESTFVISASWVLKCIF